MNTLRPRNKSEVPTLWWAWLLVAFALTMLTAISYVLFPDAMLAGMSSTFLGAPDAMSARGDDVVRFFGLVSGISSGVSLAWMATLSFIVWGPFRRAERWAWQSIAVSVMLWFAVDTGRSIATGFPQNAMLNLVWLAMYVIPLAATYGRFHRRRPTALCEAHVSDSA